MLRQLSDASRFTEYVADSDKPLVMIEYYTTWSDDSTNMKPVIMSISRRFNSQLDIVKIDANDEVQLAKMANVNKFPSYFFIKPSPANEKPQPLYIRQVQGFALTGYVSEEDMINVILELLNT